MHSARPLEQHSTHVDLTQERKGYLTETALNNVRRDYIERARGLGLRILFNTTVFDGNLAELPAIAGFFRDHARHLTLVSFQLQADTGRGVLRDRADCVSQDSVMRRLQEGIGCELAFDAAAVGHPDCNRYASVLIAGQCAASPLEDRALIAKVIGALELYEPPTDAHLDLARTVSRLALLRPGLMLRAGLQLLRTLWRLRHGLLAARGRISRLAVLVHNFMDADHLDADRCRACVFFVATEDGPLSMCAHNARRDGFLFAPARLDTPDGARWWSAATGEVTVAPARPDVPETPQKLLKGRQKAGHVGTSERPDTKKEHQT